MSRHSREQDRLELLTRASIDSSTSFDLSSTDDESRYSTKQLPLSRSIVLPESVYRYLPLKIKRLLIRRLGTKCSNDCPNTPCQSRNRRLHRFIFYLKCLAGSLFALVVLTGIFRPSYTNPPLHYRELESRARQSRAPGRANQFDEKVFISVSLYDKGGHLANGTWGQSMLELIDLIGPQNAFLSIYENDSGIEGEAALRAFQASVKCKHEIVSEAHVSKEIFPNITMPDGTQRLKRLIYLSEMRNRALRPLDKPMGITFDRILFMNDVEFHAIDAAQLLFSTNVGSDGKAQYLAVCSLDYLNPFKFYDLYATRDAEGYSMGVPFFPLFSNAGEARSRRDMLAQKDAVEVSSCWSGMVAAQAQYFQSSTTSTTKATEIGAHNILPADPRPVSPPVRFRAEPDIFFDACECCLLLADTLQLARNSLTTLSTKVFVNPYIRVAYNLDTLWWLPITRRFERLYSWPHRIINALAGMPTFNPYRTIQEGRQFEEEVWLPDARQQSNGSWEVVTRVARNGLYCGVREMQLLIQQPRTGDRNWENVAIPSGGRFF